jgi:hypothetical protein
LLRMVGVSGERDKEEEEENGFCCCRLIPEILMLYISLQMCVLSRRCSQSEGSEKLRMRQRAECTGKHTQAYLGSYLGMVQQCSTPISLIRLPVLRPYNSAFTTTITTYTHQLTSGRVCQHRNSSSGLLAHRDTRP